MTCRSIVEAAERLTSETPARLIAMIPSVQARGSTNANRQTSLRLLDGVVDGLESRRPAHSSSIFLMAGV